MTTLSACWDWKVEPVSPGFTSPEHEADFWGLDDDVTLSSPKVEKDEPTESKSTSELLDELDEWIKEEPFAVWLEEKIDLPLLDIPAPVQEPRAYSQQVRGNIEAVKPQTVLELKTPLPALPSPPQYVVPGDTQTLLQEFESVFGEVEHNFATPPQSPTQPPLPIQVTSSPQPQYSGVFSQDPNGTPLFITTLQQMIPVQTVPDNSYQFASVPPLTTVAPILPSPVSYVEKRENILPNLEQIVPSPAPDLYEELAAVDELIRTRVEDLETSIPVPQRSASIPPEVEEASSPSSFHENVGTTLEVTPPSPSTTSISSFESAEDFTDDPDWVPVSVHGVSSHGCEKVTGGRKRAAKPYARVGTEEKKLRKKEQNKNAATRYRQKKKAEVEEILSEEKQLADANEELQTKVNDLSREIKYLKGLMRDVFKAKGLLK
ncbi:hypothetical protein R5R35_001435 [Gryllus longicercus]|uniref:BZIP domain-containing protein n=1 Tax=Gryllus longicercus TaxID=2509291 RepID=A0AAN9VH91_9ORTH